MIPALIITGVVEFNLREGFIKRDYSRLGQEESDEENRAVQDLVKGCRHKGLPGYVRDGSVAKT